MDLPFYVGASKRSGFPVIPVTNYLVEKGPDGRLHLIARPGLEPFANPGTAPVRCCFAREGLFNGDALILLADGLYRVNAAGVSTLCAGATIGGSGLVDIDGALDADGVSIARIANGIGLYRVSASGNTIVQETFPDSAGVTSVQFLGGYWIATRADTDAAYRLEPPGTGSWEPLEYAAAEYLPDPLKGVRVFGELAGLMGSRSLELWRVTGDTSAPLAPAGGLKFDVGCKSLFAAVNCRGTLIFVDSDGSVQLTEGGAPRVISDHGLAEEIRNTAAADLRASFFVLDQHPIYALTLGTAGTRLYDLAADKWTWADSDQADYWRANMFCNLGDSVLASDIESNQLWRLDPSRSADGDDTFTAVFCALLEVKEGRQTLANVELDCLLGDAPRSGQGSEPKVVLRVSRDQANYGPPKERPLGMTGERTIRPRWTALGDFKMDAILKFAISDPVGRRISGVRANV